MSSVVHTVLPVHQRKFGLVPLELSSRRVVAAGPSPSPSTWKQPLGLRVEGALSKLRRLVPSKTPQRGSAWLSSNAGSRIPMMRHYWMDEQIKLGCYSLLTREMG
jgi:hypothetical protein